MCTSLVTKEYISYFYSHYHTICALKAPSERSLRLYICKTLTLSTLMILNYFDRYLFLVWREAYENEVYQANSTHYVVQTLLSLMLCVTR